ncbi:MAG: DUF1385 domain-containing protein [Armatimonadetes bacterium]|nr:DUF1385 domain-containing protein [Armatimonadota bacterium]
MDFPKLTQPVGGFFRPVETLDVADSVFVAAGKLRGSGLPFLPVAGPEGIIGILDQAHLSLALGKGCGPLDSIEFIIAPVVPSIAAFEPGAKALRLMEDRNVPGVLVRDTEDRCIGIVTPADLIAQDLEAPSPRVVGGMATPFGVYLTNGSVKGGARGWALVATGALLSSLHLGATLVSHYAYEGEWTRRVGLGDTVVETLFGITTGILFLVGLRLLPLAGIHAAEHMTVHAIERGEPLVPEVVQRMPRVHPRCGTNFAAGLMIFLVVSSTPWTEDRFFQSLVALLLTLVFWRRVGSFLQFWITTKKPNRRQVELGIQAGRELLQEFQSKPNFHPTGLQRFVNSGILQVIGGAFAVTILLALLAQIIPFLAPLKVDFW